MIWLASTHALDSGALIDAARATFDRRAKHGWPPRFTAPLAAWRRQYATLRRELNLGPATADDAHAWLVELLRPVLAGERRLTWDPHSGTWGRGPDHPAP